MTKAMRTVFGMVCWLASAAAVAQPAERWESNRPGRVEARVEGRVDRRVDLRTEHRPGFVVGALPGGAVSIKHGGQPYFHHGGVWYRPHGPRFVVVTPPVGLVVPTLPFPHSRVWVAGAPYYWSQGVYYSAMPSQGYVVVSPPADSDPFQTQVITSASANAWPASPASGSVVISTSQLRSPADPIIYPRNGQSPEQTEADRQDCNRWATSLPSALSDAQVFQRAVAACMDARGYSVR